MALEGGGVVSPGGTPVYPVVLPNSGDGGDTGDDGGAVPGGPTGGGGGMSGGSGPPSEPVVVAPVADFEYTVYAGGLVAFHNLSLGLISIYAWDFGDGTSAKSPNPLHQYVGTVTFTVSLIVANTAGGTEKILSVVIPAIPIVETVDYTYAVGALGVQFTDTSTKAGTRHWDFGDGTTSTSVSPYKLYEIPGIYTVTLTIIGVSQSYQVPVDYGITLNWVDNSDDETGFKIEHSLNGADWVLLDTVGAGITTLIVTKNQHSVDPAVTNFFRVYAYNIGGDSADSNEVETLCEG